MGSNEYIVAMLFTKNISGGTNNQMTLNTIVAVNENAAFGEAFDIQQKKLPEHQLHLKIVVPCKSFARLQFLQEEFNKIANWTPRQCDDSMAGWTARDTAKEILTTSTPQP